MNPRHTTLLAGASVAALVIAGCGSDEPTDEVTVEAPLPTTSETTTTAVPPPPGLTGAFRVPGEPGADEDAFTYDETAVPVGSVVTVESEESDGRTTVTLTATGLAPSRDFGVHVHTQPCGRETSDAGPHYQNDVDPAATPESPSTDPAYANPQNEVWLDITTDEAGNAQASSTVEWEFRDDEANSVVLHAQRTMTAPGEAGMAGDRLACIDEDF
ncbi:superoxide dismutase family protein [Rhodococcus chondri]|uniref:Superoxide dismutase family protein n=1 Tax=Rhodococcus chondri TaxID=3065941 RepID=A0ABU7JRB1_9NOCA|nr:superoxide dismutase family protein [Rhodococcus sp. CC-R104]MEE2032554.1 superoxide dismutase family protein [Rhodococcus sp. CC-R104]